jgi:hypothetical protein
MADQQNRGGKKVGQGRDEPSDKQQGVGTTTSPNPPEGVSQRPPEGQPGGPKPKSKSGRSDEKGQK